MIKLCLALTAIFMLFRGQVSAQTMGSGLSVIDCPNTNTRHGYHLYSPDTDEHAFACGRIAPVPTCHCESPAITPDLDIPNHVQSATRIWADFIGKKSCGFMQTRSVQLDAQKFEIILNAPSSLDWAWPVLLKQYLNMYSSLEGNLNQLPKFCQVQRDLSSNQSLKNLIKAYLESDDLNIPLSEKIKIYGIYAHLFGEDQLIKEKLKIALKDLLTSADNANLFEKKKVIWFGFYHLNFTLEEFARLARPALGTHRTDLKITSIHALRILNDLPLVDDSRPALQRIWFETGDREMMDQDGMLDYISSVGLTKEMLFSSVDDYLKGLESGHFNQYNSISSLMVIISIKDFSEDQWSQILNRAYALTSKIPDLTRNQSKIRRARKYILDRALSNHIPYEKISALVNNETKAEESSGDKYLDRVSRLYSITNLPESTKDKISTAFVQNYFEKMLRGERGKFTASKNAKMRKEAFDFLKDKNLTAEGTRWLLSLYFNLDVFKQVSSESIEKGRAQIAYSEARPAEYPAILQLIQNSKLGLAEKNDAEALLQ